MAQPTVFQRELTARVHTVLRRPVASSDPEMVTFGDLRVHLFGIALSRRGRGIEINRNKFGLFATRRCQVVTLESCLVTLWWRVELSDSRTLDTQINRLRTQIEDNPAIRRDLITIGGVGFRLDP